MAACGNFKWIFETTGCTFGGHSQHTYEIKQIFVKEPYNYEYNYHVGTTTIMWTCILSDGVLTNPNISKYNVHNTHI